MHVAVKIIIGLVLLAIGLGMFADSTVYNILPNNLPLGLGTVDWLGALMSVLQGVVPVMLILIGLFIVWLEADELKAEKEIKKEEKKGKK